VAPLPNPADRRLPDAGFAGDTGEAAPEVTNALASYDQDATRHCEALSVVQHSRLLVPVVALLGEVEYDEQGLAHDKTSDMAAVLMQGNDGRLALLAFTGVESLKAWNPEARPVPVAAQLAAQSALQDEAAAIVVDIAGPVTFVIEGDDLLGLARGWTLAQIGGRPAWIGLDSPGPT
jgi:hypothetical protein